MLDQTSAEFDEAFYLATYPDVAQAIASGAELSAWHHYLHFGRQEGRIATRFDEAFYLRSYPLAAREIAAGRAGSAAEHYRRIGKARGYLSAANAPRADCAAAQPSRFGGLWIDQPHVHDLIDGKLETGLITARQAMLLHRFADDGYVVLEGAIPPELLARARSELEAAYAGAHPELLFECPTVSTAQLHWKHEINAFPAKALDIHHFCPAIRETMFTARISEFLGLIFEAKPFASQTLGFLRGSAQEGHQDSAYVPYTLPRHFAATWAALEDVTLGAGELFYYVGSHRFPDFLYRGAFKSVSEAQRMAGGTGNIREDIEAHVRGLEEGAKALGMERTVFAAKAGDVLVWHADLVHGGHPVSQDVTRKSLVTHYSPKYAAPLFAEGMATRLWEADGNLWTTSYYNSEPFYRS